VYGGTGNLNAANATPNILTNYCYPGDSDPLNWGTVSAGSGSSVPFSNWSEQSPAGTGTTPNPQGDRRFMQATGPFTLNSQDTIDVTFAVVYAKELSNDPFASVEKVRVYDDSVQAFSNNCFQTTDNCLELIEDFSYHNNNYNYHFSYSMDADNYLWNFSDGTSSNERFPSHTFSSSGIHTVCLTASRFNCSSIAICKDIYVDHAYENNPAFDITRIDGRGSGGRDLEIYNQSIDSFFVLDTNFIDNPLYIGRKAPVLVEQIDSSAIISGDYIIKLDGIEDTSHWKMYRVGSNDTVYSDYSIDSINRQKFQIGA